MCVCAFVCLCIVRRRVSHAEPAGARLSSAHPTVRHRISLIVDAVETICCTRRPLPRSSGRCEVAFVFLIFVCRYLCCLCVYVCVCVCLSSCKRQTAARELEEKHKWRPRAPLCRRPHLCSLPRFLPPPLHHLLLLWVQPRCPAADSGAMITDASPIRPSTPPRAGGLCLQWPPLQPPPPPQLLAPH